MTKAIIDIAMSLGIAAPDHVVVGKNGHARLKGMRLIQRQALHGISNPHDGIAAPTASTARRLRRSCPQETDRAFPRDQLPGKTFLVTRRIKHSVVA